MEEQQHRPQQEQSQLVIRPIVKHLAIGLGVTALLGILEYATYALGVQHGYTDGVSCAVAEDNVNQKAEGKLMTVMQAGNSKPVQQSTAVDSSAFASVQAEKVEDLSPEGASVAPTLPCPKVVSSSADLQWITDDSVRAEAQWMLALTSLVQGKTAEADALLREMFAATAPLTKQGAERATTVAQAFAAKQNYAAAAYYYAYVDRYLASIQDNEARLALIKERIALVPLYVTDATALQLELSAYLKNADKLGKKGRELALAIFAWKGYLYRAEQTADSLEKAEKCFEYALKSTTPQLMPELLHVSICHATLLLERTQNEQALELLRSAVVQKNVNSTTLPYMTLALRELAEVELKAGNADTALAMLCRAEGLLMHEEAPESEFWNYLYDQRGRVNLQLCNYAAAAADFDRAMQHLPEDSPLAAQPLEGAAICCAEQTQFDRALELMTRCVDVRRRLLPTDQADLFRTLSFLGELQETSGDTNAAAATYGEAFAFISPTATTLSAEEIRMLRAYGHVLVQQKQWSDAGIVWDRLNRLTIDDEYLNKEIGAQLALCKSKGAVIPVLSEEPEHEEEEETDEV